MSESNDMMRTHNTVRDAIGCLPEPTVDGVESVTQHEAVAHNPSTVESMRDLTVGEGAYGTQTKRRLGWEQPAWTMSGRSDAFVHPSTPRTLTMREYARLQSFPDDYEFCGTVRGKYTQLKNAVPPRLARNVAEVMR